MNAPKRPTSNLAILLEETAELVKDEYYLKFCDVLHELGVSETSAPVPPEVWIGLAQAFADTSGYRVTIQAAVLSESSEVPGSYRIVDHREIASADPMLFLATD